MAARHAVQARHVLIATRASTSAATTHQPGAEGTTVRWRHDDVVQPIQVVAGITALDQ